MEKVRRFGFGAVDLRAAENDSGAFVLFPAYDRAVARIEGLEAELVTLRSENERLKDVLKIAEYALKTSYDVCDYPGMNSTQGEALLQVRAAIAQATQKGSE